MKRVPYILFWMIFFLSGCAKNYLAVTYNSNPSGATLYQDQQAFGFTPFTLNYKILPDEKNKRYLKVRVAKVIWASGVSASIDSLTLDREEGASFFYTFFRPDVPGREIDVNFALQLERNKLLQQQTEAQKSQSFWQMINVLGK